MENQVREFLKKGNRKRVLKRVLCLGFVVVLLLMGIMALRNRVPQYLFADEAGSSRS